MHVASLYHHHQIWGNKLQIEVGLCCKEKAQEKTILIKYYYIVSRLHTNNSSPNNLLTFVTWITYVIPGSPMWDSVVSWSWVWTWESRPVPMMSYHKTMSCTQIPLQCYGTQSNYTLNQHYRKHFNWREWNPHHTLSWNPYPSWSLSTKHVTLISFWRA